MNASAGALLDVPSHVPPELVWDHSIDTFAAHFDNPYVGGCDAVHAGPDIVWAAKGVYNGLPGWMLTRFAHLEEAHTDATRFSVAHSRDVTKLIGFEQPLVPSECDPPLHRHYRQFLQPWFNPSAVSAMEPMILSICDELIGKFEKRGSCEFVSEFSSLLPSNVFLALMGLPREMLPRFLEWEHGFLRGATMEIRRAAIRSIYDYFKDYLDAERRRPGSNLIGAIATGEVDGRPLDETEMLGMCIMLYIGGLDSVTSGLGWYMRHLALDPELQDRLRRDPSLIPLAVDELSRAHGTNSTRRTVTEDFTFHGVPMRKGDVVALPTFFASRDPREFADPHAIDIHRKARSMTFATGVHNCIGIHLAKREARLVIAQFLSRFDNIRIPPGEKDVWTTQTLWSVKKLPLTWDN